MPKQRLKYLPKGKSQKFYEIALIVKGCFIEGRVIAGNGTPYGDDDPDFYTNCFRTRSGAQRAIREIKKVLSNIE